MKVVDVSKRAPGTWPTLDKDAPIMQLRRQLDEIKTLNLTGQQLKVIRVFVRGICAYCHFPHYLVFYFHFQLNYINLVMKRKRGSQVLTDFGSFPTSETKKVCAV
jgi:hypothetical protein